MERRLIADYEYFHAAEIYGTGGRHYPYVLAHVLALSPDSLVDYGAGRSDIALRLARKAKSKRVARFDPAVPEFAQKPAGVFDLLVSFDVLEHVPREEMDSVLAEMARMASHALHVIDIKPAKAVLSDGRNAHVSLHTEAEWQALLARYWPSIRPIPHRSPSRVAFKTWDAALPTWRHRLIEGRELLFAKLRKALRRKRRAKNRPQ
jgi:hypothetical protein